MVHRKNTRNYIRLHETLHNSVYLYIISCICLAIPTPYRCSPLKVWSMQTYLHTYNFSENLRDPANTGYSRSINATDSTCVVIV